MPYRAGDTGGPLVKVLSVTVPDLNWVQGAIYAALEHKTYPDAWRESPDYTSQQAADLFASILETLQVTDVLIGQIMAFGCNNMEYVGRNPANGASNLLPCDGRSLATTDFPELFNRLGYTYGGSGSSFNLPGLGGQALVGAGSNFGSTTRSAGQQFGEENHTLTSGEMPAHTHSDSGAAPNATTIGPGAPEPTAVPLATITGSAGGGGAHNTMQPSVVIYFYIQVL